MLSDNDVLEIDRQVRELIDSGLVEAYPLEGIPTIVRLKKENKVRRMAGNIPKLNQRRKTHVSYLHSLEQMV